MLKGGCGRRALSTWNNQRQGRTPVHVERPCALPVYALLCIGRVQAVQTRHLGRCLYTATPPQCTRRQGLEFFSWHQFLAVIEHMSKGMRCRQLSNNSVCWCRVGPGFFDRQRKLLQRGTSRTAVCTFAFKHINSMTDEHRNKLYGTFCMPHFGLGLRQTLFACKGGKE